MRLIDADELMKYAHDVTLANGARHRCIDATVIYDIPTVDAIPVRYGKWIDRNGNIVAPFWERYECSECGARSDNSKYCHNCGAKMDADRREE